MLLGFDIGGTKCAAIAARWDGETIHIQDKRKIPTDLACGPEKMIRRLMDLGEEIAGEQPEAIGISCGGPLDSQKGVILGPPIFPAGTGWTLSGWPAPVSPPLPICKTTPMPAPWRNGNLAREKALKT